MTTFKKNLIADCLIDTGSDDSQIEASAEQTVVSCESFELRINDLLDNRVDLSSDRSLQLHSDECLSCRQTLRQYEQLVSVLGSVQPNSEDARVECRNTTGLGSAGRVSQRWLALPVRIVAPIAIVALLALLVFTQPSIDTGANLNAEQQVAVASANPLNSPAGGSPELRMPEVNTLEVSAPKAAVELSEVSPAIEQVLWRGQKSIQQLQGLVDSGSELLATGREQAAVIQGLSDVRFDVDLVELEARLAALQPVLTYSGRIPALSPMQGTVCFTLGWLRKGKAANQTELNSMPDAAAELGMHSLALQDLA